MKKTLLLLTFVVGLIAIRYVIGPLEPYETKVISEQALPKFKEISVGFKHNYNGDKSLPFMGAAVFDLKGDGQQYLFVGGGYDQSDRVFIFENNAFKDITSQMGIKKRAGDTTYGSAAIDVNQDGFVDLFVARESGLYLYTYQHDGTFHEQLLDLPIDKRHVAISIAVADLQNKGTADLFVSCYLKQPYVEGQNIFNKPGYGAKSLLLLNNGDNTFRDGTVEAGLEYTHNTFQAIFVDIDGNQKLDLVVAYDTGQIRTYRNLGGGKFVNEENAVSDAYGYPMGIAVGDYSGNGLPDFYCSNIGPFSWANFPFSPPSFLTRGDLTENQKFHEQNVFLENKGGFKFENNADKVKVANYGFGWGAVFQDFTNSGKLDLVLCQNYIGLPPHKLFRFPGRFLMQDETKSFVPVEKKVGVDNPHFGISPLYADFTGNGFSDLVYLNLDGELRVFLNEGNDNHYLNLVMPNTPSAIGAKAVLETGSGKLITCFYTPTQGLCTYQSNTLFFGLGSETDIKSLKVYFSNGDVRSLKNLSANSKVRL